MSTPTQKKLETADYLLYELTTGNREQFTHITGARNFSEEDYKNYPTAYSSFAFDIAPRYMQNRADHAVLLAHYNGTRSIIFFRNGKEIDRAESIEPDNFELVWWEHTACTVSLPGMFVLRSDFQLGTVVMTPGAKAEFSNAFVSYCLMLHAQKDWGDVCPEDARSNNRDLKDGERILSVYTARNGKKLWIITDAEDDNGVRNCTTLLLPEEY